MSRDLYCRLYMQSDYTRNELIELFVRCSDGHISGFAVENAFWFATVKENKSYDPERFVDEERFVFSRYTSEIDPKNPDSVEQNEYIERICSLVSCLRNAGVLVAAACDFEDVIAQETGWN